MQYPSANRPVAIKLINRLGRGLFALGVRCPRLDAGGLIDQACRATSLRDFGDDSFRPFLERLIDAYEHEARLSQIGRIAVKASLLDALKLRLQMIEYRKQHPAVAQQQIRRPLFVLGLPRTGTTILYELLAQDPAHRAPMSWEVALPFPPPTAASFDTDARIDVAEKQMAQVEVLAPGFKAIHEIGARLPQECVAIQASHFISDQFGATYFMPQWRAWSLRQDLRSCYQWHRMFLQHLQSGYMRERWVLKTPGHLPYLDVLVETYPDACIVQTHRDPMQVIGSISSLACTLHGAFSDHVDPVETGHAEVNYFAQALQQSLRQRDAMPDQRERFFDIYFEQIIRDPIAAIERMYAHFGFEFSAAARQAMQRYLDNRPREKHGRHTYTLQQFGLSREQHGPLFAPYCQRFAIAG